MWQCTRCGVRVMLLSFRAALCAYSFRDVHQTSVSSALGVNSQLSYPPRREYDAVRMQPSQRGSSCLYKTPMCATAMVTARCFAHLSSFKQAGYFALPQTSAITIDPSVYEVQTVRGSGPGGQGANSSSNKVELRVNFAKLRDFFDDDLLAALARKERGRALTSDGETLIVTSHAFRSAHQNKEHCLTRLREMLHEASWVPPVDGDPIERPSALVTRQKVERRKKSNLNRMRRSARQGRCDKQPISGPAASTTASRVRKEGQDVRAQVYARDYTIAHTVRELPKDKEEQLVHMWRESPTGQGGEDVAEKYGRTFKDCRPVDPNETDEVKRKRLYYQSQYRGMVEMDLILGHFARCKLATLDRVSLDGYDTLLKQLDNDLFNWIVMGQTPPPDIAALPCFHQVQQFVKEERKELLSGY